MFLFVFILVSRSIRFPCLSVCLSVFLCLLVVINFEVLLLLLLLLFLLLLLPLSIQIIESPFVCLSKAFIWMAKEILIYHKFGVAADR